MSKNVGKEFEKQLKESAPDYALLYKIPDAAQKYGGRNIGVSCRNPFDFLLWDSKTHILYALECKTVKGKSIAFERDGDTETSGIHAHQIKGLNKWNEYDGITAGFIIEFRELETTFFIEIGEFNKLIGGIDKKSFTLKDMDNTGIEYFIIPQRKKRTRYAYDLDSLLNRNKEE